MINRDETREEIHKRMLVHTEALRGIGSSIAKTMFDRDPAGLLWLYECTSALFAYASEQMERDGTLDEYAADEIEVH